jgi:hypothetical protein
MDLENRGKERSHSKVVCLLVEMPINRKIVLCMSQVITGQESKAGKR